MSKLSAIEYKNMLASVEAELKQELALSPSARDRAHVDECLETMVFIRERLNRLEQARAAEEPRVRRGLGSRPALRRAIIIALIAAAVLACGFAIAEAMGWRIGEILFKPTPGGLRIEEGAAPAAQTGAAAQDRVTVGTGNPTEASGDGLIYSEEQLRSAFGAGLLYPEDTAGFVLEYASFTPIGVSGGEVVLYMIKEGRGITVVQEYYNEVYGPENHASAVGLFDGFDDTEIVTFGDSEYAIAVGRLSGAAAFRTAAVSCTVYGSADRQELEAIITSMLRYAEGSIRRDTALKILLV